MQTHRKEVTRRVGGGVCKVHVLVPCRPRRRVYTEETLQLPQGEVVTYVIVWCLLWFSIGFALGKWMKKVDQYIRHVKKLNVPKPILWLLDALHHFQLGLLLMALTWNGATSFEPVSLAIFMLGFGLVADDAEDLREYVKTFYQYRKLLEEIEKTMKK